MAYPPLLMASNSSVPILTVQFFMLIWGVLSWFFVNRYKERERGMMNWLMLIVWIDRQIMRVMPNSAWICRRRLTRPILRGEFLISGIRAVHHISSFTCCQCRPNKNNPCSSSPQIPGLLVPPRTRSLSFFLQRHFLSDSNLRDLPLLIALSTSAELVLLLKVVFEL